MAISQNMEKRLTSFGLILIAIFVVLTLRLAYLQLLEGDKFLAQAENNRVKFYTIGAPRGKIITADGQILVSNKMAYSASIQVSEVKGLEAWDKTLNKLIEVLKLNRVEVLESLCRNITDGRIVLIEKLTPDQKAIIDKEEDRLPGVRVVEETDVNEMVFEDLEINVRSVNAANLMKSAKALSEILPLKYDDILFQVIAQGLTNQKTLKVKRNLTQEEMVMLEELRPYLPGVLVEKISIRDYVYGSTAAHALGYVGAISMEELQLYKDRGYRGDDYIGKSGLELQYEQYLRGQDGREEIEVNSLNQKIRTLGINAPIPGSNLITNIDFGLQRKAEELLDAQIANLKEMAKKDSTMKGGPKGGALIVMDVHTGKILALTSRPNFDLNLFAGGISSEDYKRLNSKEANKPFLNRVLGNHYPPGSIFKMVSATAYLEEKVIDEYTKVYDANGRYMIGDYTFDNWARTTRGGYGWLNVVDALAHSNNIFFYEIAHKLYRMGKGGITIPEYARGYGLGKNTGIDLPGETPGVVPDSEYKRKRNSVWLPGDTLHVSIGQGDLRTTAVQLVNYTAAIANGGRLYKPYVVDRIESYDGLLIKQMEPEIIGKLPISQKNLGIVRKGMEAVSTYGTATSLGRLPFKVAGKTGTAQTDKIEANHGWYAGYAPADKPEIAILVFLENGTSSSYTVPIVRDLLMYYFVDRHKQPQAPPAPVQADGTTVLPGTAGTPAVGTPATGNVPNAPGTVNPQNPGQATPGTPGASGAAVVPPTPEEQLNEKLKDFYNQVFSTP